MSRSDNAPMLRRLIERDGPACHYCGVGLLTWGEYLAANSTALSRKRVATVDHRTPQIRGGPHRLWNCVLACHGCNAHKARRPYLDFMFEMWLREAA
jgi:5-methylcytosine-specific restriction endonuclease McrA